MIKHTVQSTFFSLSSLLSLFFLALLFALPSYGQEAFNINEHFDSETMVGNKVGVIEVMQSDTLPESIFNTIPQAKALNSPFLLQKKNERFWIYFKVKLQKPQDVYFVYASLDTVSIFIRPKSKEEWRRLVPEEQPFYYFSPKYVAHILTKQDKEETYEVLVSASSLYQLSLSRRSYFEYFQLPALVLLLSSCFGAVFIIFLYNLFLFISVKDNLYLYYLLYLAANTLFLLNMANILEKVKFYNFDIFPKSIYLFPPLTLVPFILLFSYAFLRPKKVWKIAYLVFGSFALLLWLLLPVMSVSFAYSTAVALASVTVNFMLVSGLVSWIREKNKNARFFVLAFLSYIMTGNIAVLVNWGYIEQNDITQNILLIGSVFEAAFLSFALADRINIMKKEREEAQHKALSFKNKNEQILRNQNEVLEQKVQERTQEISTQNEELQQQQEEINAINERLGEQMEKLAQSSEAINASIRYAQTIQEAILPQTKKLEAFFQEIFILYRPQHIVSGDFFWFEEFEEYQLLAVGDCTGHGVPGAFMSLLGMSFLSEAAKEKTSNSPEEILDQVNTLLISSLKQKETGNQDGMELIVCRLESQTIKYAASKRPLFVVLPSGKLQKIKGSRRYIGVTRAKQVKSFEVHTLERTPQTMLYLTSDGYQDQPNPQRKRLGSQKMLTVLQENAQKHCTTQKEALEKLLDSHQQDTLQVDDITILGVRL
jgi:serine phosphatase RsbU (regulator of sigma subunit)